jgi:DNA-binding NtrC family response regulator
VEADWPGNVRQLRNLIESMVVLAPEGEIRASDIPADIRERNRPLPVRIPVSIAGGQEFEFILRSLVELKLQVEELRRRLDDHPPMEVIEIGSREQGGGSRRLEAASDPLSIEEGEPPVVIYRPGMSMADVERAAIDAALREMRGNRRKAAEVLGIGERTLYRKLKEYAIV